MRVLKLIKTANLTTPENMATTTKKGKVKRSVELPEQLWQMLGEDAERTHRSINGMLSALLDKIYTDADVELRDHTSAVAISQVAQARKRRRA